MDIKSFQKTLALFASILFLTMIARGASAQEISNPFNQLVLEKHELESRFGVKSLECFPFIKHIGFTEDQAPLIRNCLAGARSLKKALAEIPDPGYRVIGISNRFLRTGGFHTALVPWDASTEELVRFLSQNPLEEERKKFLDKIYSLKKKISRKIEAGQLYCSLEISNEQCLKGYETLAKVELPDNPRLAKFREIQITHSHYPLEDPHVVTLGFDNPPERMRELLLKDVEEEWKVRKKVYETIKEKYGEGFKTRLQLEKFVCAPDLSPEECLKGAENFFKASEKDVLQEKFWGRVTANRYNTLILDDFNAAFRFDLPPEKIVEYFSKKASRQEATRNSLVAEKLEGRTKNNSAGLRGVCDLSGLQSSLCARAFQNFIDFLKKNRDYHVSPPWTDLMFIDGNQLSRVNFALNSQSRDTYLFIDANSSAKEFSNFLFRFKQKPTD